MPHDHSPSRPRPPAGEATTCTRRSNESHGARSDSILLERALRELLIEKGVFTPADVQRQIELTESRDPELGAKVVAHAWTDAAYKAWLLGDAKPAIETYLGIDLNLTPELVVVENSRERHHVICCTLCSCYPRAILGIPPAWYKSLEYRSRVVIEPRAVLAEFGTRLADDVEIRVVDSTADMRYMVLPMRPPYTENMSEEELVGVITRDSMIGVSVLAERPQ